MTHGPSVLAIATLALFLGTPPLVTTRGGAPSNSVGPSGVSGPKSHDELTRVRSRDGTPIAVECAGSGPTLVIVHGGIGDRTRWTPMFPLLEGRLTVCAMDRRGHGASGDSGVYSLQKEAEDVAAVVDSRPGEVFVLGHSYGGVSALEATFLTRKIARLILYEPPLREPAAFNLAVADSLDRLIASGRRDQAVATFLHDVVGQSPDEIAALRARPGWAELAATIDLQPRQMRALAGYRFEPARMKAVRIPTLLLTGGETRSPYLRRAIRDLQSSLPHPTLVVLPGQQHNAMDRDPELLAREILHFLAPDSTPRH